MSVTEAPQPAADLANTGPGAGATPHLVAVKAEEAIAFYQNAFGAEEMFRTTEENGPRLMHAHLKINGGSIYLCDDFPEYRGGAPAPAPAGFCLHLHVDDADAWWQRAIDAGAEIVMPIQDMPWGDRYGQIKDPWGYTWSIAASLAG